MDPYEILLRDTLEGFLKEDCAFKDVTSSVIPPDKHGSAIIVAREAGVCAGLVEAGLVFSLTGCVLGISCKEGNPFKPGDSIASVTGKLASILSTERVALNLLMHLCGVATATRAFQERIDAVAGRGQCKIAATRKTTPGMRAMEKRAVMVAGGDPHRWSLDDMVLLKDTHRSYYNDVAHMVSVARNRVSFSKKIEVEVETTDDAIMAARAGADIIMLDNMPFSLMKTTMEKLEHEGLRQGIIVESSGNVTLDTVADHARTGVDIISTSAITLKAMPVDISLELV
ncbi:carboxylating nicotinate-nucleotide diphosphorylase [Candidatus Bathyarchaeota archaeon]|nr:carboxylating nicotinate-nucleotide diphosphorylase [Candidatus Bathyarchaeota archaeon]